MACFTYTVLPQEITPAREGSESRKHGTTGWFSPSVQAALPGFVSEFVFSCLQ